MPDGVAGNWVRVAEESDFAERGRKVIKVDGKQIAIFLTDDGILACDNRCPHEGYPLSEGTLADGCILTCNWHNWKFDLSGGKTLIGGDSVRVYPARIDEGTVWLDLSDPPPERIIAGALDGLRASFDRHEYGRMAREIARIAAAGGDPLNALRHAIRWTHDRYEYGTTHAVAGAADWLALRDQVAGDPARELTALTEAVGHFAWDSRREPEFPFAPSSAEFDPADLAAAIEAEDEPEAIARVRGALAAGMGWDALEPVLARAALAHYQDFGHSLIYVYKTGQLLERLGPSNILEPLVLMLVRSLVTASREDLIPEFKAYAPALTAWDGKGRAVPAAADIRTGTVAAILDKIGAGSGNVMALYDRVMEAAAWQLLHYDLAYQDHTDKSVSQNVTWLSFTHALTFGNALRKMAERYPELWPPGLLQMGCFLGRNAGFLDETLDAGPFDVTAARDFLAAQKAALFDHGNPEFIVSCHLVKTTMAIAGELEDRPDIPWGPVAVAALNRFLQSPFKRKHALRTAKQALALVARP